MKKKRLLSTKITIFVIAGIGLFFIFYIIFSFSGYEDKDGLISKLYQYTGSDVLDYCDGLVFYDEKKVTFDTLENSQKLCLAYLQLSENDIDITDIKKTNEKECLLSPSQSFRVEEGKDNCTVKIIAQDTLNKAYNSVFGKESVEKDDFVLSSSDSCYYNEKDDNYYCGQSFLQNITIGWAPTSYRFIKKVSRTKDIITIIDYFLLINQNRCYLDNYGANENVECTKNYKEKKVNNSFIKKYGKRYIHTFKKINDTYYWESTKPI